MNLPVLVFVREVGLDARCSEVGAVAVVGVVLGEEFVCGLV